MKAIAALSDYLPNTLAAQNREGWLPSTFDSNSAEAIRATVNDSVHGEALLYATKGKTLIHIGHGIGKRGFNYARSGGDTRVIMIQPLEESRSEILRLLGQGGFTNIHCIESIHGLRTAIAECGHPNGEPVSVYIEADFFSLGIISEIASVAPIDLLIGGYRENSWQTPRLYQDLKKYTKSFRLLSEERKNVIFWNHTQQIDVSVVVPVYNIETYLPQCLDSVSQISEINCEILVIDDGSKDGSANVVRKYSEKFPHIRLISQINGGCAAARQRGLEEARGTYVGFLDGDDWVTPGMFEKLFARAIATNADVAMCGYCEEYNESGKSAIVDESFGSARKIFPDCYEVDPDEIVLYPPTIWRKIFRKAFLNLNAISFDTAIKRFDDLLFNGESMLLRPRVVSTSGNFYHYRLERPGQTVGFKDKRLFVHFEIFESLRKRVSQIGRAQTEILFKKMQIGTHFWVDSLFDDGALKAEYRELAGRDLFGNMETLDKTEVIRLAMELSPEKEQFVKSLQKN
ncbi:glycosyltransferase [Burkholderia multivorans]|nr:glycosyltransferase [Burkholderia multivorans]